MIIKRRGEGEKEDKRWRKDITERVKKEIEKELEFGEENQKLETRMRIKKGGKGRENKKIRTTKKKKKKKKSRRRRKCEEEAEKDDPEEEKKEENKGN